MNEFEGAIPILNVKNLAASMDCYVNKLGFEKKWDWGNPPTFGYVERGKLQIRLCERAQGRTGRTTTMVVCRFCLLPIRLRPEKKNQIASTVQVLECWRIPPVARNAG